MRIRVPATTANLGPGFDSCGLALACYLTIEVGNQAPAWQVKHNLGAEVPTNRHNLLVKTALRVVPNLEPREIKMLSDIPLARGLGSSSSVIVAGIELANRLGKLNLSKHEKLCWAAKLEGHPDNVAPAIFGDFVVASQTEEQLVYAKHYFPACEVVVFIPDEPLLTVYSRQVLPESFSYKEAVAASSVANVMIAAIFNGDLRIAGQMMEKDAWHEPYRQSLVPHLKNIREIGHQAGAYGCYLSGAGPTVAILVEPSRTQKVVAALADLPYSGQTRILDIDREGCQCF